MTEDLHRALKTEVVARQSVGNAHFMLVKLQHGKDNFTYSLHAESSTLFTSGPKETDFFVWLGFEYGPCNFVSGQRCFVKAVSSSFDLGSFCATFASAFADIAAAKITWAHAVTISRVLSVSIGVEVGKDIMATAIMRSIIRIR